MKELTIVLTTTKTKLQNKLRIIALLSKIKQVEKRHDRFLVAKQLALIFTAYNYVLFLSAKRYISHR